MINHMYNKNKGNVLVMTLVILLILLVVSLASFKSMANNNLAIFNFYNKNSVAASGEYGLEVARKWLIARNATITGDPCPNRYTDCATEGFYSSMMFTNSVTTNLTETPFDIPGFWNNFFNSVDDSTNSTPDYAFNYADINNGVKDLGVDSNGNTVKYVIFRMCPLANQPSNYIAPTGGHDVAQNCLKNTTEKDGSSKSAGKIELKGSDAIMYNITVMVTGARNNKAFLQSSVLLGS